MQNLCNHITRSRKPFSLKSIVDYCIVLVFGFSLIAGQSFAFFGVQKEKKETNSNIASVSPGDLPSNSHQPFEAPFESDSAADEQEAADEKEDIPDDEPDNIFCKTIIEYWINLESSVGKYSALTATTNNRTTVSLFILHHSWKSFL